MSRANDFIQFDEGQFDDVENIVEQTGKTCDVFRASFTGTPGFGDEVGSETRVKRILVHVARASNVRKESADGGIESNIVNFVGLTTEEDVLVGDIWRVEGKRYRVTDVDTASKGKTEVKLELMI